MTYTTQQLQVMSDFEVNKALAVICGEQVTDDQYLNYEDRDERAVIVSRNGELDYVDYCNNPNDIMPLAFERNFSVIKSGHVEAESFWIATNNIQGYMFESASSFKSNGGASFIDKKPLRAIACLLLIMGD